VRVWVLSLVLLGAACAAGAQLTPIPWHPKVSASGAAAQIPAKKKAGKGAKGSKGAETQPAQPGEPPKYHMTFDSMTTLSPGVYVAEGHVRFESEDMLLTADSVTYDSDKGTLWATGRVAVDWGSFTASGSELHYDMNAGTGNLKDGYGVQQDGDFTVFGDVIRKTGADWYEVDKGTFTSCTSAVPPWSLRMSKGRFHIDHYAFLDNPRFHVRQAPILYAPYLIWPIKPERSTGFLIPTIGDSSLKGFTINTAFFIAPKDWWDDTVYLDWYEKQGWGVGEEFRYALTPETYGWFRGYYIRQKSNDQKRWDAAWTHLQTLPNGWSFTADLHALSDIQFPADYLQDFNSATVSGTDSRLYLTRNWGPYALNFIAERRRQYFTEGNDLIQSSLPNIEFRSALQPLFAGIYGGFETSAAYLHKEWADSASPSAVKQSISYGRLDLHPFVERPFHFAPWLDMTPRIELRATGYSQSLDPQTGLYDAGNILRAYARAVVDFSGPRLYRKFKNGEKHVIEPYFTYSYISRDMAETRLPIYDEVDTVFTDQSAFRLGIRNRLYDAKGGLLLDADLYQSHSFTYPLTTLDGKTSQNGPLSLVVRAWPMARWSADLRLRFNVISHALDSESFAVTYRPKKDVDQDFVRLAFLKSETLGVSEYAPRSVAPPATEIRLTAGISLAEGKVVLAPFIARDILTNEWRDLRLIFWYHGSCFSIGFDAGKRTIGTTTESAIRFLVSLRGVGTVVDVTSGRGFYNE
jgi:hypothetical protein